MEITITTDHSASSYGQPVILIDGNLVDGGYAEAYEAIKDQQLAEFFSTPTTLAEMHDPAPHIARAEKAEKQYGQLAAAVRKYYFDATGVYPDETVGADPVEMLTDLAAGYELKERLS